MNHRIPSLLILALLLAAPGTAIAYTPHEDADGDQLEPNPLIRGNVTIGSHKPDCDPDILCFYDDSDKAANLATYGLKLNPDVAEPVQFRPQSVDCQYYGEDSTTATTKAVTSGWCANITGGTGNGLAWLDPANWATSTKEGNDTIELTTRNGAHALHIVNAGNSPAEADEYALDFDDITTDVGKIRLVVGIEIVSRSGEASFNVYDGNGSGQQQFVIRATSGTDATGGANIANGTGIVYWDNLVSQGTQSNGGVDGDISKLVFSLAADSTVGPSEVYIYALALQVKRFQFGLDEDGEPVYNMTYTDCDSVARSTPLGYTCLAEFAPNFDYQNVKDLKVAYEVDAASLPAEDVTIISRQLSSGDYAWEGNYRMTFHLPKMIDLTYAGDEVLTYTLPVAGKQHTVVKAAGVDKIKDVEKKKLDDKVTLIATPAVGKDLEVEFTVQYTDAQMRVLSEVGFLGLPSGHLLSRAWVWLSGLAVVGGAFAWGLRRTRS